MNSLVSTSNYCHFMPIMCKWSDEKQQPFSWSYPRNSSSLLPIEGVQFPFRMLLQCPFFCLCWSLCPPTSFPALSVCSAKYRKYLKSKIKKRYVTERNYFKDNLNNQMFIGGGFLHSAGLGDSGGGFLFMAVKCTGHSVVILKSSF